MPGGPLEPRQVPLRIRRHGIRYVGIGLHCLPGLAAGAGSASEQLFQLRIENQQLSASWYLAKALAPGMQAAGWGRFIHVNGPDGWFGGADRIPHSVAKGGLRNLTKSLAAGLGPYSITVNDVVPGFQDTVRDPVTHPMLTEDFTAQTVQRIPIRRQPTMAELAWACVFLASPRSGGITGSAIHVDGGQFLLA